MISLFTCAACGLVSTRGPDFVRREGVNFDRDCLKQADAGQQPAARWVAEAIEDARARIDPSALPCHAGEVER